MKNLRYFAILLAFGLQSTVFAQVWKPTTASVTFKIKHALGSTAEGSLKGFVGNITFNPANLQTASISASVDSKTIDTGLGIRDKELREESYFDVEKYPKISIVSTKIEKTNKANEYIGTFNIIIKKTTKTLRIPFIFTQNGNQGIFKGSFSINRIEYGVGEKSSLLSDTAMLTVLINTQQQ